MMTTKVVVVGLERRAKLEMVRKKLSERSEIQMTPRMPRALRLGMLGGTDSH